MLIETAGIKGFFELQSRQVASVTPKADSKFFVSWMVCSSTMFILFYFWHGMVLNDFSYMAYSKAPFLVTSVAIYLVIGMLITFLTYALKKIKNSFKYGLTVGAAVGVLVYMVIVLLLGLSFYPQVEFKIVAFDLGWQVVEQSAGGLLCGWIYRLMYIREKSFHIYAR